MYINKLSNYMLNSSRNVFVIILKLNFLEIWLELVFIKNAYQNLGCLFT